MAAVSTRASPPSRSATLGDVLRMHVTQGGRFTVGSAQCPMHRDQLAAVARAHSLVVKANLTDASTR